MHRYFIKTPALVRYLFPEYTWKFITGRREVYLSFDDGPHPEVTPLVLDELKKYDAKATFFCVGQNVSAYPYIYRRILAEGHSVGNHGWSHLNGWKTKDDVYLDDFRKCEELVHSKLFRPPYGRVKRSQAEVLLQRGMKVIMWDVLSADFDEKFSVRSCLRNVTDNVREGSIVVFHDSEKAFPRLKVVLPEVLSYLKRQNYICKALHM